MVNLTNLLLGGAVADLVEKFISWIYGLVGNYGVAVIVFTLTLKIVLSPLDVWQKVSMRKNNKAMERMKPKLEKLQKQCGGNRELYQQKQMQLYKEEGYKMTGSCLPMILTMVIFFMVFAGFRATVKTVNQEMYEDMYQTYFAVYDAEKGTLDDDLVIEHAQNAVKEKFESEYKDKIRFLWVKNVFMPDSWKDPIPNYKTYTSSGLGGVGATDTVPDAEAAAKLRENGGSIGNDEFGQKGYETVMGALMDSQNTRWNGFLILPLLTIAITVLSTKLNKPADVPAAPGSEDQQQMMQANTKMMNWMMPVMMGIFAIFYSSAFTVYMVVSSLFSTAFQLIYNLVAKKVDKSEEDKRLSTTYK